MASQDVKSFNEKTVSPVTSSVEPVELGVGQSRRKGFLPFTLEVRQEESSFAASKNASNADFDPIPPSKRTWTWKAYVAYWMADAWAVSNWEVGMSQQLNTLKATILTSFLQLLPSLLLVSAGKWPSVLVSSVMPLWVSSSPSTAELVLS